MINTAFLFAVACLVVFQLNSLPSLQWLWAIVPVAILFTIAKARLLAVFLIALLWALFQAGTHLEQQLSPDLITKDLKISGIVSNIPDRNSHRTRFEFKPDQVHHPALPYKLRLSWYQSSKRSIEAGERWQLTVRLKPPHGMMNPSNFDYESWLFQQNIGATGYVRSQTDNRLLEKAPPYHVNSIRQNLISQLDSLLATSPNLGIIQALTTGTRHNISQQQWQVLRASGTSHLVAISGLHIGLAAALGFFSFRWFWSRRANNLLLMPANEAGALAGLILALFYAALAGFAIPTQRALIMLSCVTVVIILRRSLSASHILASAALIILIINPLAVLSAGFWLSFTAVAIILFICRQRFPAPKWQWLKVHSLIALGLTPLLFLFFMQTSLVAPLANFIAVPVISLLVVPLLLVFSLLLPLSEGLATLTLNCADVVLSWLWQFLEIVASLPFAQWNSPSIGLPYWLLITLATIIILSPRGFPAKWLAGLAVLPLFFTPLERPENGEVWFSLLDVGQGLAAVVQTQNHTLLFDAGPRFGDSFDSGKMIVQPFLQGQSIQTIDTLIISHGDNDHIGGAAHLVEHFKIGTLLSSVPSKLTDAAPCIAGQSWQWDNVSFTMLNPNTDDVASANNLSCVLRVSTQQHSILLTGDIEKQTEKILVQRYGSELQSTIMVAPHHGSNTSSTPSFIHAVNADIILFPTGYLNRYHFPSSKVVSRYARKNSQLFNTADDGAILIKLQHDKAPNIIRWRHHAKRIWIKTATD